MTEWRPNGVQALLNKLSVISLAIVAVAMVWAIYLVAFQGNPPSRIFNDPLPVDKAVYYPGDDIVITIDYCRYTEVPFTSNVSFVDSLVFALPPHVIVGAPKGCGVVNGFVATVPESLPPGTYYLLGRNVYEVNVLATRTLAWTSQSFEVVHRDEDAR